MFFLGEYAGMVSMGAIAATLYLGGYWAPGLSSDALEFAGPVILLVKIFVVAFLIIWIRWTYPRLREDQLQAIAWKWLIPLALVNIVITATLKVVPEWPQVPARSVCSRACG